MDEPTRRCGTCGEVKNLEKSFYRDRGRPGGRSYQCRDCFRAYEDQNRDLGRARSRKSMRKARQADPEKARRMEKDHRDKARKLVFDHYGHACSCPGCGSTRRLVIDHVNGDGREWRIRLFGRNDCGSRIIYLWLIRNGFPDEGLQVLCQPCNASKGRGTACRLDHAKAP